MPLLDFMKNTLGQAISQAQNAEEKSEIRVAFPSHLTIPVDVDYVRKAGLVNAEDTILPQIQIDIAPNKSFFSLDQLTMLNVLAANNFRRPICFTSPYGETGFTPYLRQVGLIWELVPVKLQRTRDMDVNKSYDLLVNKFRSGNADKSGVYFDEENRRHLLSIRQTYAIAASNLADAGRKPEALKVLQKSESLIKTESLPYAMVSRFNAHNQTSMIYLEAAYKTGYKELTDKLKTALRKDLTDQKKYYDYLKEKKPEYYSGFIGDEQDCDQFLRFIDQWEKQYSGEQTKIINEQPGRAAADSAADSARKK
jgi:hypothetical protein